LDPPRLRHSELLCAPSMPPCQKSASTSDGPKYRCTGAAKITQNTSQMDITPWYVRWSAIPDGYSASTSDGPKYRCTGAAKITQNTSQMDITPW
jgi:hypothetical protein